MTREGRAALKFSIRDISWCNYGLPTRTSSHQGILLPWLLCIQPQSSCWILITTFSQKACTPDTEELGIGAFSKLITGIDNPNTLNAAGSTLSWSEQLETNFLLHVYLTYTDFIWIFQSTHSITRYWNVLSNMSLQKHKLLKAVTLKSILVKINFLLSLDFQYSEFQWGKKKKGWGTIANICSYKSKKHLETLKGVLRNSMYDNVVYRYL